VLHDPTEPQKIKVFVGSGPLFIRLATRARCEIFSCFLGAQAQHGRAVGRQVGLTGAGIYHVVGGFMRRCISFVCLCGLLLLPSFLHAQSHLETPSSNSFVSGLGFVAGWKCAGGNLTFSVDNGPAAPLAYGISRADTQEACGHGNTGFIAQENWNLVGNGQHTIHVFDNGKEFASAAFTVTTLGQEFLTGIRRNTVLDNFPQQGKSVELQWQENAQGFVITSVSDRSPFVSVEDNVPALTTRTVFTVPTGQRLILTDVIISNPTSVSACCAEILRNGSFATSLIPVPAGFAFQHTFATGIEFAAGDTVGVRNDANFGFFHFYLSGFVTTP
jgi:hypothetical protein